MVAYYNEIDPFAAAWLRELVSAGHIAPGDVDERSIVDVRPDDLRGYTQCHFFAGIGVWSLALRRAGWPDDRPVWTMSCPCQPFSAAGKGLGFADERHLWPSANHLIGECGPATIFGEQVASKAVDVWIDLVQADVEALGYAFGAVPFPSAGVGAPHIRDRTYWLADAECNRPTARLSASPWRHEGVAEEPGDRGDRRFGPGAGRPGVERLEHTPGDGRLEWRAEPGGRGLAGGCGDGGLADPDGRDASAERQQPGGQQRQQQEDGRTGGLADTRQQRVRSGQPGSVAGAPGEGQGDARQRQRQRLRTDAEHGGARDIAGPVNGIWRDADWLFCRDGKWRPVEPGTFPLAHGAPARVGRLRGYGNAINAVAAQTFIEAYLEKDVVFIDAERVRLGVFA